MTAATPARHGGTRARQQETVTVARITRHRLRQDTSRIRQLRRLRRTVVVAVSLLLLGTVIARGAQDPAVALPRQNDPVVAAPAAPALTEAMFLAPPASAPDTAAQPDSEPVTPPPDPGIGEAEEGAAEPTAAPGATLAAVPDSASGNLRAVPIPPGPQRTEGRMIRYAIEIEDGIAVDPAQFAGFVQATLTDPRGWQSADGVRFVPVSPEELAAGARVDLRVALATPRLTARLCTPLNVYGPKVSCYMHGRAVLNLLRWERGSASYGSDLAAYRTYLVNHEVGHSLGHGHGHCPRAGQPAPIMLQQTLTLENCTAWPWPTRP